LRTKDSTASYFKQNASRSSYRRDTTVVQRFARMSRRQPTWDDLRILLAVHRGKSFLAAGKALGVATSTVARRIEALEASVGRPLVHRGNGGTQIDADALGLVALGEQMEHGFEALRRGPSAERISGTVRVSASEGFVRHLVRVLASVQAKHPALLLEVVSESRFADLARREADIGIRIAPAATSTLVEKRVGRMALAVFGARSYVEQRLLGARLSREDAARHEWVGFDRPLARLPSEVWMRAYGAKRFVLRGSSPSAVEEAVVMGMGFGVLGEAQGAALGLVRVQTESAPPSVDVFVAFHRDAKRTPRIRVVLDAIQGELRRLLA
jgi:DNA-binding transcriptional LysR family regulator